MFIILLAVEFQTMLTDISGGIESMPARRRVRASN